MIRNYRLALPSPSKTGILAELAFQSEAIVIVAVVAIVVRGRRVLAMRRAQSSDANAGYWETLSGRVEAGEEPFDAMRREITEEAGLEVELERRPLTVYAAKRGNEDMICVVYRGEWRAGEVVRSEEHDAHEWLTVAELAAKQTFPRLVDAVRLALS